MHTKQATTFSKPQRVIAWCSLAVMAAMLLHPPWLWHCDEESLGSRQFGAGYRWLWAPPAAPRDLPAEWRMQTHIWWDRLTEQWLVVGIGMVVLLYLREARDRDHRNTADVPTPQLQPGQ